MKQLLLICAVVALVGCSPAVKIADPIVEKTIRAKLNKPTGELTQADLEKVVNLDLRSNQLTDVTSLEKLTHIEYLVLESNQLTDVTGLENLTQLTYLSFRGNRLASVKGLEKLDQLTKLNLLNNPDLTKAQIDQLQKALPKCTIFSDYD